jgi:hypothetical protein
MEITWLSLKIEKSFRELAGPFDTSASSRTIGEPPTEIGEVENCLAAPRRRAKSWMRFRISRCVR